MKHKVPLVLSAGFVLLLSLFGAGKVAALRKAASLPIGVTIDGMSFFADESADGDATLLRRELARLGVQPPDAIEIPAGSRNPHPAFSAKLAGSPEQRRVDPPDVPSELKAEHTVRKDEGDRTVELVIGRMEHTGDSIRSRLAAKGWTPVSTGGGARLPRMLESTRGKETAVVFLDETEGTFLIVRKLDR